MQKFTNYILDKIFIISSQPVLFNDLLEANALFNEGMMIDPAKLNFRFNYFNLYIIYSVICIILLMLGIAILHKAFVNIDLHFSIISTAIITAVIFIGFDIFKLWARKQISQKLIKKAWKLHLSYFDYDIYKFQAEKIYNEAMKNEISRKNLEKFVLERLVAFSKTSQN